MSAPLRLFWLLVLGGHAAVAGLVWLLLPAGFPVSHPRFWTNQVAPFAVLALVAVAAWADRPHRQHVLRATLVAFPSLWVAGAFGSRLAFPVTFGRLFLGPLAVGLLMALAHVLAFGPAGPRRWGWWGTVLVSLAVGGATPFGLQAPEPATRPANVPWPQNRAQVSSDTAFDGRLGPRLMVAPGDGSISVRLAGRAVVVRPVLKFLSRSPDGAPTILAPRAYREEGEPHLSDASPSPGGWNLRYRAGDGSESLLRVRQDDGRGPLGFEAVTRLEGPIYSHLNSYCDIDLIGFRRLALEFSPCPGVPVEVRASEYPVGLPLRFAYLDGAGRFRVVEASSGEKGPFRRLAEGRLGRGEPLGITLLDDGVPVATLSFDDWSAQVDTQLSPTAGWRAPVNAIEFTLAGNRPGASASVYMTLAGTSVGRGWDSVGHRVGTYRNRVRVQPAASDVHDPGKPR